MQNGAGALLFHRWKRWGVARGAEMPTGWLELVGLIDQFDVYMYKGIYIYTNIYMYMYLCMSEISLVVYHCQYLCFGKRTLLWVLLVLLLLLLILLLLLLLLGVFEKKYHISWHSPPAPRDRWFRWSPWRASGRRSSGRDKWKRGDLENLGHEGSSYSSDSNYGLVIRLGLSMIQVTNAEHSHDYKINWAIDFDTLVDCLWFGCDTNENGGFIRFREYHGK